MKNTFWATTNTVASIISIAALGAMTLWGCGKDDAAPKDKAEKAVDTSKIPLDEINKLGGEHVQLELKAVGRAKARIHVAVPKGWKDEGMMGLSPPSDKDLGRLTSFRPSTNCDGACESKDWKPIAMRVTIGPYKKEGFKVTAERELKSPAGYLIVAESKSMSGQKTIDIAVARWKEGASRYMTCTARLTEDKALPMAGAFTRACETAIPEFLL